MDEIEQSLQKLQHYILKENHTGYDPYDTLTGWFPFHKLGKWPPVIAIQLQKRNPFNIRPLLGIKKDINPKAMGLFLQGYTTLYQATGKAEYKQKADYFFNWLKTNFSNGYSGKGWGYNFPWASPLKYLPAFVPSAVVTGFVIRGVNAYSKIETNPEVKELIASAADFIRSDLDRTTDDTGICISYTPQVSDVCYNASLLAAEVLAYNAEVNQNTADANLASKAVQFVIARQKESGLWAYSEGENGRERIQTDFHQGYVVESIYRVKKSLEKTDQTITPEQSEQWNAAMRKGVNYYRQEQFLETGQSLWRLPKQWPIEIHNQAQGIITFTLLKEFLPENHDFAHTIANFTLAEMQDKSGHFYYHKYKHYTHKIPYMRWSQAWMFVALTTLIHTK